MNNSIIKKSTTEFDVLTVNRVPQIGDKWEDARNIYTITGINELFLTQCPMYSTRYYIVHLDVWGKDICSPDEPETILMEYDPYMEVEE